MSSEGVVVNSPLYDAALQLELKEGIQKSTRYSGSSHTKFSELENHVAVLCDDKQRDDARLKALQEISDTYEEFANTDLHQPLSSCLLRVFVKVFQDTVPQFIGENNTQQLRRLLLELIYRMNCVELIKVYLDSINTILIEAIISENEDNGIIAVKILSEIIRTYRPPFTSKYSILINSLRGIYLEMTRHISVYRMFEQDTEIRPRNMMKFMEDSVIESSLQNCYTSNIVYPDTASDGSRLEGGYHLIPRASQSVRLLSEIPVLAMYLFQIYRSDLQDEVTDFVVGVLNYLTLSVPNDQKCSLNFNRTLAENFYCSQAKALTLLSYVSRASAFNVSDVITGNVQSLVNACHSLMKECPSEALPLRREIISALKNFFTSDIRAKFASYIPKLFTELALVGNGYSVNDQLRMASTSALADIYQSVRLYLPYSSLRSCLSCFMMLFNDVTLAPCSQAIAAKLILNIADAFAKLEKNNPENSCRDLFLFVIDSLSRKIKVMAKYHLPLLLHKHDIVGFEVIDRCVPRKKFDVNKLLSIEIEKDSAIMEEELNKLCGSIGIDFVGKYQKTKFSDVMDSATQSYSERQIPSEIMGQYWANGSLPMTYADAKHLIKVCVYGCRHLTIVMRDTHVTTHTISVSAQFKIYDRIFRYGLSCLGFYMISSPPSGGNGYQRMYSASRSREEKEALESFASIFSSLTPNIFKEIMTKNIELFIRHLTQNSLLQVVFTSFLTTKVTSAVFGTVVLDYLMDKLPDLAACTERSTLYLKLFKSTFSAVSSDIEIILKPYIHVLVHQTMDYAIRGREPTYFFLLLRSMFRSIGSGSFEQLYQYFLPLLPSLLQELNRLQRCIDRTHLRELFVELCLTVPVRLSSLLPYMPLLMEPLAYASKGSPNLMQQGLRTLELCVDNLAPEYLQEHITPVKVELVQGLWKALSTSDPLLQSFALRILGKFGASNRSVLCEPQTLAYNPNGPSLKPSFQLVFQRSVPTIITPDDHEQCTAPLLCELPIKDIIIVCLNHLRPPLNNDMVLSSLTSSSMSAQPQASSLRIRRHSLRIIEGILLCAFEPIAEIFSKIFGANRESAHQFRLYIQERYDRNVSREKYNFRTYKLDQYDQSRKHIMVALQASFYAFASGDLHQEAKRMFLSISKTLTICALIDSSNEIQSSHSLDSFILIDAIAATLVDPSKELCNFAIVAFTFMKETALNIIDDVEQVSKFPLLHYVLKRMIELCYEEAWHSRLGGCTTIKYLCSSFPQPLIIHCAPDILKALFDLIKALRDEVSNSTVDVAISAVNRVAQICLERDNSTPLKENLCDIFVTAAVENLNSASKVLRNLCKSLLEDIAKYEGLTILQLLEPKTSVIECLFRHGMINFEHMSLFEQAAFLDVYTYVKQVVHSSIEFTIDDRIEREFLDALGRLCCVEESNLLSIPNYHLLKMDAFVFCAGKRICLTEFRLAALKAVIASLLSYATNSKLKVDGKSHINEEMGSSFHLKALSDSLIDVVIQSEDGEASSAKFDKILAIAVKCLVANNNDLQEKAFVALQECSLKVQLRLERMIWVDNPVLLAFRSRRNSCSDTRRMYYFVRLTPAIFKTDTFIQLLLDHLNESAKSDLKPATIGHLRMVEALLEMVELLTNDTRFIHAAVPLVAKLEASLALAEEVNLRYPLLKFLIKCPNEAVQFLFSTESVSNEHVRFLFKYFVKHDEGENLREVFMKDISYFMDVISGKTEKTMKLSMCSTQYPEIEHLVMQLMLIITKRKPGWMSGVGRPVIEALCDMWNSDDFQARYSDKMFCSDARYCVPRLVAQILLNRFRQDIHDYELLFDLCSVYSKNFSSDFSFLRCYIEEEIIRKTSIHWRQQALKLIVAKLDEDPASASDIRIARALQYIVIPSLHYALDTYNVDEVMGAPPNPDDINDGSLASLVCEKIMDKDKYSYSDAVMVMIYHLGCLLVSKCPAHIHDMEHHKKQSERLRALMTIGWAGMQTPNSDITRKFMGHFLVANIINKYSISGKICLRVFQMLVDTYNVDSREIVKKSFDTLIPSLPYRMHDGHHRMATIIKKAILREGHCATQVQHCISAVYRQHMVFYPVRHKLTFVILNALNRLIAVQVSLDIRRLTLDVCEMIIKWEQYRISVVGTRVSSITSGDGLNEGVYVANVSAANVKKIDNSYDYVVQKNLSVCLNESTSTDAHSVSNITNIHEPIAETSCEQVLLWIFKMSLSMTDTVPNSQPVVLEQQAKRSFSLLKICLMSDLWGLSVALRPVWMQKHLAHIIELCSQPLIDQNSSAVMQITATLDLLTQLCSVMAIETILANALLIQGVIVPLLGCMYSPVMRSLSALIEKLFERTKAYYEGSAERDSIYQCIAQYVNESLTNYENSSPQQSAEGLQGAVHLLGTICRRQPAYLDLNFLNSFTNVLRNVVQEYLARCRSDEDKGHALVELILNSLEIMQPRICTMQADAKRQITNFVIKPLIDKDVADQVIDGLVKVTDAFVRTSDLKETNHGINTLFRLAQHFQAEDRYEKCKESFVLLLETLLYCYETPHLRAFIVKTKLNVMFHWGLSTHDASVRRRFFKLFNLQVPKKIYERLYHIIALEKWDQMQTIYWITHCINLLFASMIEEHVSWNARKWPTLLHCAKFSFSTEFNPIEERSACNASTKAEGDSSLSNFNDLSVSLAEFSSKISSFCVTDVLPDLIDLIYNDAGFAEKLWIDLFPSIWSNLTSFERASLQAEITPFLLSAVHVPHRDLKKSAVGTFFEALSKCSPEVKFTPDSVLYMARSHRQWYQGVLLLENRLPMIQYSVGGSCHYTENMDEDIEILFNLKLMYKTMLENDQVAAMWNRNALNEETVKAVRLMNQDRFEEAAEMLVASNDKLLERANTLIDSQYTAFRMETNATQALWIDATRELNRWDELLSYADKCENPMLLLESSWHIPCWDVAQESLRQLSGSAPSRNYYKILAQDAIYHLFTPVNDEDATVSRNVENLLSCANKELMKEWERLPAVVSTSHIPILQAAHLFQEIRESAFIYKQLLEEKNESSESTWMSNVSTCIRSIVKTRGPRHPSISDPVSFWNDIYSLRIHQFNVYDNAPLREFFQSSTLANQITLPLLCMVQSKLNVIRAARRNNLFSVAYEGLDRLQTLPSYPLHFSHTALTERLKCALQEASYAKDEEEKNSVLIRAVAEFSNINFETFGKEQFLRILTTGARLMSLCNDDDKLLQMFESSGGQEGVNTYPSLWMHWGDHLEKSYHKNKFVDSRMLVDSIYCAIEAAISSTEIKARKHISRLIWRYKLTSMSDSWAREEADKLMRSCVVKIPASRLLLWISHIFSELKRRPSKTLADVIMKIGEAYPQKVFISIYSILPSEVIDECIQKCRRKIDHFKSVAPATFEEHLIFILSELFANCPPDMVHLNQLLKELGPYEELWVERTLRTSTNLRNSLLSCVADGSKLTDISPKIISDMEVWIRETLTYATSCQLELSGQLMEIKEHVLPAIKEFNVRQCTLVDSICTLNNVIKVIISKFSKSDIVQRGCWLQNVCPTLSNFSNHFANIETFVTVTSNKVFFCANSIYHFLSTMRFIIHGGLICRHLSIRAVSGRVHSILLRRTCDRPYSELYPLLPILSSIFAKEPAACRRFLKYKIPRIMCLETTLVSECSTDTNLISTLYETLNSVVESCPTLGCADAVLTFYLGHLDSSKTIQNDQTLMKIVKVMNSDHLIPIHCLTQWFGVRYCDATQYYIARKQFVHSFASYNALDFILNLKELYLEDIGINLDTGCTYCIGRNFKINTTNLQSSPTLTVPFRLSNNISHFISPNIEGNFLWSMYAVLLCFKRRNLRSYLHLFFVDALFRNANILVEKLEDKDVILKAIEICSNINSRVSEATLEMLEEAVKETVLPANLAKMPARWHPWF